MFSAETHQLQVESNRVEILVSPPLSTKSRGVARIRAPRARRHCIPIVRRGGLAQDREVEGCEMTARFSVENINIKGGWIGYLKVQVFTPSEIICKFLWNKFKQGGWGSPIPRRELTRMHISVCADGRNNLQTERFSLALSLASSTDRPIVDCLVPELRVLRFQNPVAFVWEVEHLTWNAEQLQGVEDGSPR